MSLAPASFPGPLSLPNPAQTQEPGITTAFSKPPYKDLYGKIYRKIRQIREIDEYRRFAILVLRGQPLKQQGGSPNDIDELLIKQIHVITSQTGQSLLSVTSSYQRPRNSLLSILTYHTCSWIFKQKGDYSQTRFLAFCVVKRSQRPTSTFS